MSSDSEGAGDTKTGATANGGSGGYYQGKASSSFWRRRSTTSSTGAVADPFTLSASLGRGLFSSSFASTLGAATGSSSRRRRGRGRHGEQEHQQRDGTGEEANAEDYDTAFPPPPLPPPPLPPAAAAASGGSAATAGEAQRALHEEVARLHRSLGIAAQETEVLREEVRAKEALASRLQEQNDGLLREAKLSRSKLKKAQDEKARVEEELAAARAAGATRLLSSSTSREDAGAGVLMGNEVAAEHDVAVRGQLARAMGQLGECLETIEGLEASLLATERERDALQQQLEQAALWSGESGGREASVRARVLVLEEEVQAVRAKYAKAKAALRASKEEKGHVHRQLLQLQRDHQQLQQQWGPVEQSSLLSARGTPGKSDDEVRRLRGRVRELEAVLSKVKEVDAEAEAAGHVDRERLVAERRRLQEAEAWWRGEVAAAKERVTAAEERAAVLEGKLRKAKQAVGLAQEEVRELRGKFRAHVEETEAVVAELERARGERARRAQELAVAQAALADTRGQLEEALRRAVAWEKEREGLLRELQVEKGRARGLEAAVAEAADRIVRYEEELVGVQRAAAAESAAAEVLRRTSRRLKEAAVVGAGAGGAAAAKSTEPGRRRAPSSSVAASLTAAAPSAASHDRRTSGGGVSSGPPPALLDTLTRLRQATAAANTAAAVSAAGPDFESEDEAVLPPSSSSAAAPLTRAPRSPSSVASSTEDEGTVLVPHGIEGGTEQAFSSSTTGGLGDLLSRCRTLKTELAAVIEEDQRLAGQWQPSSRQPPPSRQAGSNATERIL